MPTRKRFDWATWFDGLKAKLMEAAGTALVTMFGSNGVAAMHIPGLEDVGMNWKTAVAQFTVHILFAAGLYMRDQRPAVIEEIYETSSSSTNPATGSAVVQSTKTTTTTPVAPVDPETKL